MILATFSGDSIIIQYVDFVMGTVFCGKRRLILMVILVEGITIPARPNVRRYYFFNNKGFAVGRVLSLSVMLFLIALCNKSNLFCLVNFIKIAQNVWLNGDVKAMNWKFHYQHLLM